MKYLSIIITFFLFSCGSNDKSFNSDPKDNNLESKESIEEPTEITQKLIKEGWIDFETENIDSTRKSILESINKYNAYISSDQGYANPNRHSNTMIIRIPTKNFDVFLADATIGVEKFDNKNIETKDVTEEFLDIEARLKNKREIESRYIALLSETSTISEILEIEKQIGELRSEIESVEGRLKYLENRVSYSTLSITFYTTVPNYQFKKGISNGIELFILFLVALVNIWPFLLLGFVTIYIIRLSKKRKKKS